MWDPMFVWLGLSLALPCFFMTRGLNIRAVVRCRGVSNEATVESQ